MSRADSGFAGSPTLSPTESDQSDLDILYPRPPGAGWGPVERLARLAAAELGGRLVILDRDADYPMSVRARSWAPRLRGSRRCLVIAPLPIQLYAVLERRVLLRGYSIIAGWVVDSFLREMVPLVARRRRFDHLYVTDPDDIPAWGPFARTDCRWLAWGSDTLAVRPTIKSLDLLRVGRQPPEWDDDAITAREASRVGIDFAGRPPFAASAMASHDAVLSQLARARFTLAFSNLVDASDYTHSTRAYLTARWTDALAHGAIVAGIAPESAATTRLLWEGATVDLGSTDLASGLARIRDALDGWNDAWAERNRVLARRRLDWRHRLVQIADDLELDRPDLRARARELATE